MKTQVEKSRENKSRAVANSVVQKKSNVKQGFGSGEYRPKNIAQRKILSNVIQMGPAASKMAAPATTKIMGPGSKVFRATTQSPSDLKITAGMTRLEESESVPAYRIPLYMMFSSSNPGVISTARTLEAAQNFGMNLQQRNQEDRNFDPVYIYEIDAEGQKAIDMEKTVPSLFQWLYKSEKEEMIFEDIPEEKIKELMHFGENESDKPKE